MDELQAMKRDRDSLAAEVLLWRRTFSSVAEYLFDQVIAKTDATGALKRYTESVNQSKDASGAD